jgi:hypothetical protein
MTIEPRLGWFWFWFSLALCGGATLLALMAAE